MIFKNCVICGKEFSVYPNTLKTMTCSRQCSYIHSGNMRVTKVSKVCPICGKSFVLCKSKASVQETCSKKCAGILRGQNIDKIVITCVVCGKEFNVPPCRKDTATTCSNKCAVLVRAKSRERQIICVCKNCGKEFKAPLSVAKRRVYCSKQCQYSSNKFLGEVSQRVSGDKNPMWKGGETNHSGGYIYKRVTEHPFASNGYVFKHRLVMEEYLRINNPNSEYLIKLGDNLYLSPDYIVHHMDEDRKNNDISNLLICSNSVHTRLHRGFFPEPGTYWPHNAKIRLGKNQNKESGRQ